MACILTRLFPPFRRRRQALPDAFVTPSMPTSDSKDQTSLDQLANQEDTQLFYLSNLAQQGSCSLIVSDIPSDIDLSVFDHQFRTLPGFTSVQRSIHESRLGSSEVVINFSTAAEAAMALATQPAINLGNGQRHVLQYLDDGTDQDIDANEPARKRTKVQEVPAAPLQCCICGDSLPSQYTTPCFFCKSAWCYACLENQFHAALDDQERFPARCCGRVLHFSVASTTISEDQYVKYRTRFEQFNTTKPIYCANSSCSAFLPQRVAKPNDRGHVHCPECDSFTCTNCREIILPQNMATHQCPSTDETSALLKKFGYKRCSRCGAGVAKMFGCSHVRCSCGAHWCWDCQRPIQMCWSKPCERAREDGEVTDEEGEQDDESEGEDEDTQLDVSGNADPTEPILHVQTQETEVLTTPQEPQPPIQAQFVEPVTENNVHVPAAESLNAELLEAGVSTPVASAASPSVEPTNVNTTDDSETFSNLDGSNAGDWEAMSFDFGDEPVDESWDIWGCMHDFDTLRNKILFKDQKNWLPNVHATVASPSASTKQIECMRCYKVVLFTEEAAEIQKEQKAENKDQRADSACDVTTSVMVEETPNTAVSIESTPSQPQNNLETKKQKKKRLAERPKMFYCWRCGVFYCFDCKKAVKQEIHGLLERRSRS